jgi:LruC domain-containing protein
LRSALAQDADQDGIPNAQDVFPCDARASAAAFGPAEGVFGLRIVEDQWPSAGDYDFNDGVVAYNLAARQDAAGRTTRLQATFDLVAAGGDYDNGLALQLPVPAAALASATVDAGGGPVPVSPSGADAELTVVVVPDLRAALGGARGPINSRPDRLAQPILRVTLALDFATPVDLPMGLAPFDLFVFRVQDPSLEIHRPQYAGTAAFDAARLGTQDDRSSPGLGFVDRQGVPFVLDLPVSAAYPAEGTPISSLYPDILTFGASGGAQAQDFYLTHVAATAAYQDAAGQPAPAPAALPTPAADTSCIREVVVSYTGAPLSFTVPAGVTQLEVKMWGSGGGGTYGGAGGYTAGLVPVTPGEVLGLEVGRPHHRAPPRRLPDLPLRWRPLRPVARQRHERAPGGGRRRRGLLVLGRSRRRPGGPGQPRRPLHPVLLRPDQLPQRGREPGAGRHRRLRHQLERPQHLRRGGRTQRGEPGLQQQPPPGRLRGRRLLRRRLGRRHRVLRRRRRRRLGLRGPHRHRRGHHRRQPAGAGERVGRRARDRREPGDRGVGDHPLLTSARGPLPGVRALRHHGGMHVRPLATVEAYLALEGGGDGASSRVLGR